MLYQLLFTDQDRPRETRGADAPEETEAGGVALAGEGNISWRDILKIKVGYLNDVSLRARLKAAQKRLRQPLDMASQREALVWCCLFPSGAALAIYIHSELGWQRLDRELKNLSRWRAIRHELSQRMPAELIDDLVEQALNLRHLLAIHHRDKGALAALKKDLALRTSQGLAAGACDVEVLQASWLFYLEEGEGLKRKEIELLRVAASEAIYDVETRNVAQGILFAISVDDYWNDRLAPALEGLERRMPARQLTHAEFGLGRDTVLRLGFAGQKYFSQCLHLRAFRLRSDAEQSLHIAAIPLRQLEYGEGVMPGREYNGALLLVNRKMYLVRSADTKQLILEPWPPARSRGRAAAETIQVPVRTSHSLKQRTFLCVDIQNFVQALGPQEGTLPQEAERAGRGQGGTGKALGLDFSGLLGFGSTFATMIFPISGAEAFVIAGILALVGLAVLAFYQPRDKEQKVPGWLWTTLAIAMLSLPTIIGLVWGKPHFPKAADEIIQYLMQGGAGVFYSFGIPQAYLPGIISAILILGSVFFVRWAFTRNDGKRSAVSVLNSVKALTFCSVLIGLNIMAIPFISSLESELINYVIEFNLLVNFLVFFVVLLMGNRYGKTIRSIAVALGLLGLSLAAAQAGQAAAPPAAPPLTVPAAVKAAAFLGLTAGGRLAVAAGLGVIAAISILLNFKQVKHLSRKALDAIGLAKASTIFLSVFASFYKKYLYLRKKIFMRIKSKHKTIIGHHPRPPQPYYAKLTPRYR